MRGSAFRTGSSPTSVPGIPGLKQEEHQGPERSSDPHGMLSSAGNGAHVLAGATPANEPPGFQRSCSFTKVDLDRLVMTEHPSVIYLALLKIRFDFQMCNINFFTYSELNTEHYRFSFLANVIEDFIAH